MTSPSPVAAAPPTELSQYAPGHAIEQFTPHVATCTGDRRVSNPTRNLVCRSVGGGSANHDALRIDRNHADRVVTDALVLGVCWNGRVLAIIRDSPSLEPIKPELSRLFGRQRLLFEAVLNSKSSGVVSN